MALTDPTTLPLRNAQHKFEAMKREFEELSKQKFEHVDGELSLIGITWSHFLLAASEPSDYCLHGQLLVSRATSTPLRLRRCLESTK